MKKIIQQAEHNKNKGWVLYARKSTESEDRQIQSIDDQTAYLKEIGRREKLHIAENICEAKSAKAPDAREGFTKLLALIEKGKVQGILVWKLDRLSRNPIDSARIQWYLQTGKIKCIKTSERNYWPEDNALLFAVEQGMANQYIRDLSKNVKRGLYSKAEKGWFPGIPPIGYLNTKTGEKGAQEIITDPKLFKIVRKMWDLMLTGNYTPPHVLRIATKEWGLITPQRKRLGGKPMAESNVYKVFTSLFYTGNFYYGGKLYKGNHVSMITMAEFERVQTIMGNSSKPRAIIHEFPFTGIMTCVNCGAAITATEKKKHVKATGETKIYTYYHCTGRKRNIICCEKPITVSELETQVENRITENTIHPLFYQIGLEVIAENKGKEDAKLQALNQVHINAIHEIEKKLARLFTFLLNGTINEEEYSMQKKELENNLALEKAKQSEAEKMGFRWNEITENVFHFAKAANFAFKKADPKTCREIFSSLGSNHRINDKKLLIDLHSWFFALKKGETELLPKIEQFELEKTNPDKAKINFLQLSLLVRGVVDDVRTELMRSNEIPHIPDLSHWVGSEP
jgi:DNA invertase Pin-like site-specific DNA recombinase